MQSDKKKFAARRLSGSRLVLRHLSEQQHLLLHPFLRFAHSNLILRTAVTAREPRKRKSNRGVIIISLIFAFLVCGIFYYFYDSANKNKELEAYEYAMQSSDPMVLQSYLDTYKDADEAHRDSIMAHLELLKQTDQDWTNAVVSGSKEARRLISTNTQTVHTSRRF